MNEIVVVALFVLTLIVTVIISMFVFGGTSERRNRLSKSIIDKFEPDNTAPKLTELIDFDRENTKIRYKISSER